MTQELQFARDLIDAGMPVFVAPPADNGVGYRLPAGWQQTRCTHKALDAWQPGWAICAVTGVALDVIDVDPRNGGDRTAHELDAIWPRTYARVHTPGGGWHDYVARLRIPKYAFGGIDVQAGDDDGNGRGFVFLPGTTRPHGTYRIARTALETFGMDETTGEAFKAATRARGASSVDMRTAGQPGEPILANHDNTLSAYTMSALMRHRGDTGKALADVKARAKDCVPAWRGPDSIEACYLNRWLPGAVRAAGRLGWLPDEPDHPADDVVEDTWTRVDLLEASQAPPVLATLQGLLYPGLVHDFHGESESGKSFLAQYLIARQSVEADVLYLDFESDAGTVARRLKAMGADLRRVDYRRPEGMASRAAWAELTAGRYAIAVLDGVSEAMGIYGLDMNSAREVGGFHRQAVKPLTRTGAAVLMIDHVVKSAEGRGRFAIGSQHKMAILDGASYLVDVIDAIGPGMRGQLDLRVAKDRNGDIRSRSGVARQADRTQCTHIVTVDSRSGLSITLGPPPGNGVRDPRELRNEENVLEYLEVNPRASTTAIQLTLDSGKKWIYETLPAMVRDGRLLVEEVGRSKLYSVKVRST